MIFLFPRWDMLIPWTGTSFVKVLPPLQPILSPISHCIKPCSLVGRSEVPIQSSEVPSHIPWPLEFHINGSILRVDPLEILMEILMENHWGYFLLNESNKSKHQKKIDCLQKTQLCKQSGEVDRYLLLSSFLWQWHFLVGEKPWIWSSRNWRKLRICV